MFGSHTYAHYLVEWGTTPFSLWTFSSTKQLHKIQKKKKKKDKEKEKERNFVSYHTKKKKKKPSSIQVTYLFHPHRHSKVPYN